MASDITLSAGVRQNLLSLQGTADLMGRTQNRLATGKEVNSALDNPTNFFTSQSLQSRSNDLSSLLDSMSNGIKTLEAADNGLTSITKTLESMQSTLRQARQDKTFQTDSYTVDSTLTSGTLDFSGGAIGEEAVSVNIAGSDSANATAPELTAGSDFTDIDLSNDPDNTFSFNINGEAISIAQADGGDDSIVDIDEAVTAIQAQIDGNTALSEAGVSVSRGTGADANKLVFTSAETGADSELVIDGLTAGGTGNTAATTDLGFSDDDSASGADGAYSTDELVRAINNNADLDGKVRASNDDGQLRIENLSTQELNVDGVGEDGTLDGASTESATIGGNEVRKDLANQFNELRDQLDKLSDDASFNGINLLRGDQLTLTFNETGTSTIDIQTKDGETINSDSLSLNDISAQDLDQDSGIDALLDTVGAAVSSIRSQSSAFGSNLSIVENRQDFTMSMMNTLQTGADQLVLADTNEEGANMLALQTRQQLSTTALSMASQADQAVLRLF